MKSLGIRLFAIYIVVFFLFTIGMFFAYLIPVSAIRDNLISSSYTLEQENLYPVSFGNKYSTQTFFVRDQYSDCIMLNIAASGEKMSAAEAAITAKRIQRDYGGDDMPRYIREVLNGGKPDQWYDWYWHGYMVFLRPLLTVFDYSQIRWFNSSLFLLLLLWSVLLIARRINRTSAILFVAVLMLMHFEVMPYTLMYASIGFGTLLSIIVLLSFPTIFATNKNDLLAFFVIGAWTVFVDLLSTPVLTLGIPLTIWLLWKERNTENIEKTLFKQVIVLSIMWILGYSLLWVSKWGLCAITYDPDVLENAMSHAYKWSGNNPESGRLFMSIGVIKKYIALIWSFNWIWIIVAYALILCWKKKVEGFLMKNLWLLLIACIPIVWSLVLVNHTFVHFGFAWRQIGVALMAMCFWLYKSIEWKK